MSSPMRETIWLRFWAWLKIQMLGFVHPAVVELDDLHSVVLIRLSRRTRNHLGSMYFGALCVGATVPSISGNEPVAQFTLTLSLKAKSGAVVSDGVATGATR